jgi:hypothetical protein
MLTDAEVKGKMVPESRQAEQGRAQGPEQGRAQGPEQGRETRIYTGTCLM